MSLSFWRLRHLLLRHGLLRLRRVGQQGHSQFVGARQLALEFLRQLVGELVLRDADRVGLGFFDENSTISSSCSAQRMMPMDG